MKNHLKLFVLFTCVLILSSCGKKDDSEPANSANRVKTYTEEIGSTAYSYSSILNLGYDGNNRITSLTSTTSPGDKFIFSYHSNNNYSLDIYTSGSVDIHEDFFLRNNYLDSTIQYNDSQDTMSEKYIYNASNQLIRKLEYEHYNGPKLDNTISYDYDASGNMIKSTDTDDNVETYVYYTDQAYVIPQVAPFFNAQIKAYLQKTHTVTSNGYLVGTTTSTYTFDSNNRISTVKESGDDGSYVTKTFTYF